MLKELNNIRIFFDFPTKEFNVREVARILKIAPATASKKLKEFSKKGILKEKAERNLLLYKANLENESYRDLKIYYNIRKIKESGLVECLNLYYLKPTIILFGSFSEGMDNENSDIDLVIISEKTSEFPKIKEFEKKLSRTLQLFVVKDINDLKNNHLINNVINGINIQGKSRWI